MRIGRIAKNSIANLEYTRTRPSSRFGSYASSHGMLQIERPLGRLILAFLLFSISSVVFAQIPTPTDITSPPIPGVGHDYIEENIETVNPANGSLSLRIGVPLPKSRGVNIPFSIAYDSGSVFTLSQALNQESGIAWLDTNTPLAQGGWNYSVPMLSVQDSPQSVTPQYADGSNEPAPVTCHVWTNYVFQDASASRYSLGIAIPESGENNCSASNGFTLPISPTPVGNLVYSQVGPIAAATNSSWISEGEVSQVDVLDADGNLYKFGARGQFNSPSYGYVIHNNNNNNNSYNTSNIYGQTGGMVIPDSVTDRNGNTETLTNSEIVGQPVLTYTDSIGRTALSVSSFGGNPGLAGTPDKITVSGLANPYTVQWSNVYTNYTINMAAIPSMSASDCGNKTGGGNLGNTQGISSITLPNGQSYSFLYNSQLGTPQYGLINQITYPTGGVVTYTWSLNTQSQYGDFINYEDFGPQGGGLQPSGSCTYHYDTPAVQTRVVSVGGQNVEEQDFTYTTQWDAQSSQIWDTKTTTVITKDLIQNTSFKTVYTYKPSYADSQPDGTIRPSDLQVAVESQIEYYGTNGALLRTVNKVWASPRVMTQQATVLDNGEVSETDWTYNCNEMLSERDDYDYGTGYLPQTSSGISYCSSNYLGGTGSVYGSATGTRGVLLRKTLFPSYQTFSGTVDSFLGVPQHIVDKPTTVELEDGSGSVVAGVTYGYDAVGNLLSRGNWLNSTGSSVLTTSHTYDGYGNMHTTVDPANNTTTYNYYPDSFVDTCTFSGSSNAYLTSIVYPTTNGVQHKESFGYHCASGELANSTDENSQQTTYVYNDPLLRLTETDYPTGWGKSTIAYVDTPNSISVETKRIDSSNNVWAHSFDLYDGIERPVAHISANGETANPWDRKDTCYDGLGNVYMSTYLYQTSSYTRGSPCSNEGDTMAHDALGRVTSVTHSDSTSTNTVYKGRATDVKDEGNGTHNIERIAQSDALGRLGYVCEVTGQAQNGVSPTGCGLDYGATGFLTQYQYTARGDLAYVYQGAETRNFTYDLTSRLLQTVNPENGTLTYTYDTDSQCSGQTSYLGELISKTDTRGVKTCMQYDGLHRVTAKSYTGGSATAPPVTYAYDQTSAFGVTLNNTIGRMSSESTGGAYPTGSVFSYDTLGHVINNSQCTPQNCGTSMFSVTYPTYNVLGEPNSATDGAGHTYTYNYNTIGRLSSLTSSLNDVNHPGTLLSNIHYNAFGSPVTTTIGGASLTDIRGYDVRGRLGSKWVGDTSSYTNGTGTITIGGSEQGHGPPTHSTGSVTINGAENSIQNCDDAGDCNTQYDYGAVVIVVGSVSYSASYGQDDTPVTIATSLVSQMNGGQLSATQSGSTITFTSTGTGSATNYSLTDQSQSYSGIMDGNETSFAGSFSGPMTGGGNVSAPYDSGTVSATINGTTSTAIYGGTDTPTSVAVSLANAINADSSYVTATASNGVVTLTSNTPGTLSDYSLSASSASTAGFSSPSFSPSPSGSALGSGTGGAIYSVGVTYFPNGDIESSNDSVNLYWLYTYDDFNRLLAANSSSTSQIAARGCSEVYDQYGNRLQQNAYQGSCNTPQYTASRNNNRLDQLNYEAGLNSTSSGNVIWDGMHNYTYDAESRVATVDAGGTATYVYNASGIRVRKITSSGSVDYIYDLGGHVISEINTSGGWNRGEVYAGGAHVATYDGGTTYFNHTDWIGTERLRSTVTGAVYSTWLSLPFGEGSSSPNPGPTHFTGKERDAESGNDYFGARYFGSISGRFMSPDWAAKAEPVPYAKLENPQSLNLYQYVGNNPVTGVDPDGHVDPWTLIVNAFHGKGFKDTESPPGPPPALAHVPAPPKEAVRTAMMAYHPNKGGESVAQIAGRVNHETNGMKDSPGENKPLAQAKVEIAASRINAEEAYGDKVESRAGMASPTMSGPGFSDAVDATIAAAEAKATGSDPTHGAVQYNMRTDSEAARGGPFYGQEVHTQSGPYQSPTPYTWVFTYGPH